jgi:hypothetical protein
MFGLRLGFEQPIYLLLLAGLPILWWIGYQPLLALGPVRRWIAISLRSLLWTFIVFALSGVQWVWSNDRLTVMYLLDQSESIPIAKRQMMLDYAIRSVQGSLFLDGTRQSRFRRSMMTFPRFGSWKA